MTALPPRWKPVRPGACYALWMREYGRPALAAMIVKQGGVWHWGVTLEGCRHIGPTSFHDPILATKCAERVIWQYGRGLVNQVAAFDAEDNPRFTELMGEAA